MKISTKLMLGFLMISVVPLVAMGVLYHLNAEKALTLQVFNQLRSIAGIQENRIKGILDQNLERVALVSSRTQLRISMNTYLEEKGPEERERLYRILKDARSSIHDFEDIHLLDLSGEVVVSTDTSMIGTNHSGRDYFTSGRAGKTRSDMLFLDENGHLKAHLSSPLYLENRIIGVVVIRAGADNIISLVQDYTGLGRTGETTLAMKGQGGTALFIAPLRFDPSGALSHAVSMDRLDIPIVQALRRNERLFTHAADYRGEEVLAATRYIKEADWGLVVKIDRAEAFAPIVRLHNMLEVIILVSGAAVVFLGLLFSRAITSPIARLTKNARNIASGDLSVKADISSGGEVGSLAEAFNTMTAKLINANIELEQKIRAQANTEKSLRSAHQILELFFKYTQDNIVLLDREFNFIRVNEAYARTCQRDVSGFPGHNHFEFYPSDAKAIFEHVVETKTPYTARARPFVLPDRPGRDVTYWDWTLVPIVEEEDVVMLIFTLKDVTEQKKAGDALKNALLEKETLLREIHHRVKNNLLTLYSLINMQQGGLHGDEDVNYMLEVAKQRIHTMGKVHQMLYQTGSLMELDFAEYIQSMASEVGRIFETDKKIEVSMDLEPVTLTIDEGVPCGLILNELLMNAYKHAFAGRKSGHIFVSFSKKNGVHELQVSDDGVGMPEDLLSGEIKTMGLQLVTLLTGQLQGTITYNRNNGSTFRIAFNRHK